MLSWVGLLARLVTGGVLLWAGLVKLPEPDASVAAVRAYQLLPLGLTEPLGLALPMVEVVVGTCLVTGTLTRLNATLSGVLMAAFVIGISSVWVRHIPISCGCFGDGGTIAWKQARASYPWEIARDAGLMLTSLFLLWRPRTPLAVDNLILPRRERDETDVEVRP